MPGKYIDALHQAQTELKHVEERRAALVKLIELLTLLSEQEAYELTPPPGYAPKGLTEEIKTILRLTMTPMEPTEIRDALIIRNFPQTSPKNLLISVHTVLMRIKDELEHSDKDGKPAYRLRPLIVDRYISLISAMLSGPVPETLNLGDIRKLETNKSKNKKYCQASVSPARELVT